MGRRPRTRFAGSIACRDPLRPTWAIRRAPRVVGGRGVGRAAARGDPVRAAGPGPAERRRVHPRRPRIGPGEDAARVGARRPAFGAGHRVQQPDAGGRHAGLRGRRGRRDPRHPGRTARRPGRVAQPVPAPGLGGPPHGVRRRVPRPATRRFTRCAADPARATPRGARARGRAGRRSGLLRRRPDRVRGRPPTERAHLAAAGGIGAHRRLRIGRRRGRPAGGRWRYRDRGAGRHLRRRLVHADEHLRAQSRDAARARPRRRLLAAADEPLPRGARAQAGRSGPRRRMRSGSRSRPPAGRSSSAG